MIGREKFMIDSSSTTASERCKMQREQNGCNFLLSLRWFVDQ